MSLAIRLGFSAVVLLTHPVILQVAMSCRRFGRWKDRHGPALTIWTYLLRARGHARPDAAKTWAEPRIEVGSPLVWFLAAGLTLAWTRP